MQSGADNPSFELAGAVLSIDLDAVRENYCILKRRLGDVACAPVVKADAYGLGGAEIALALRDEGCDTFCVVHVAEGLALRAALGSGPRLFILNGLPPGSESTAAEAGLTAVVNCPEQAEAWSRTAQRLGRRLPAVLQVDSGMSRLGLAPADFAALVAAPHTLAGLSVDLVMSHLACADEPDNPANAAQLAAFSAMRAMLPGVAASLANSSGIFLGPAYHFDLARPGAALYGVNPTPGRPNPMRQPVRLSAKVIQTRDIEAGTGIGYGHAFRTTGPLRAATVSLGYADGWPRRAEGAAFLDGVRLPFAGRVSMDSIILDVSALEPGQLRPGDLVEMIGPQQTVDDVAALSGTIGYEILTGLGSRFHRRYLGQSRIEGGGGT